MNGKAGRLDGFRPVMLGAVGFLTACGAHVVVVNLPAYGRRYGLGYAALGLLLAAYNLAEMFVKPVAGRLADRWGPRPVMAWGTGLFSLANLAYLVLPPTTLPALRICQGVGAGALSVTSMVLVVAGAGIRPGKALGVYNAMKGAGYVCAPLFGSLGGVGLRGAFLATGLAGVLVLFLQLVGRRLLAEQPRAVIENETRVGHPIRLWPWYLANFGDMALLGILLGFLPVKADAVGFGRNGVAGLMIGVTIAYLIAQPISGAMADRTGRTRVVLTGLAAAALGLSLLGAVQGFFLVVLAVGSALCLGAAWTNSLAKVGEIAGRARLGGDLGFAGSCKDLGDIVGPLGLGLLAQRWGLGMAFAVCGAAGAAVAAAAAAGVRGGRG